MGDNSKAGPVIFFGLIGLVGLVMILSNRRSDSNHVPASNTRWERVGFNTDTLTDNPKAKHYVNTKEWNITLNEDGIPIKIVKHVDAWVT